jgi:hypothetical protein
MGSIKKKSTGSIKMKTMGSIKKRKTGVCFLLRISDELHLLLLDCKNADEDISANKQSPK